MTPILFELLLLWELQSSPLLGEGLSLMAMGLQLVASPCSPNVETNGSSDPSTALRAQKLLLAPRFRMGQICSFKLRPKVRLMAQEVTNNATPLRCQEVLARLADQMRGMLTRQCPLLAQAQSMAVLLIRQTWNAAAPLSLIMPSVMSIKLK